MYIYTRVLFETSNRVFFFSIYNLGFEVTIQAPTLCLEVGKTVWKEDSGRETRR